MARRRSGTLEEINRWHEGLSQISQTWVEWLSANAAHYPTYGAAWRAFKAHLYKEQGLSLREIAIANSILFE